jgi:hypothetical protein
MRLRPRAALVAAAVSLIAAAPMVGGTAAASPAASQAAIEAAKPVVTPQRYLKDVKLSTNALKAFGGTLQSLTSLSDFKTKLPLLRLELRVFDGAIRQLRGYRLVSGTLNGQRARLATAGPPLARDASDFLDAVRDLDRTRVQELQSVVQSGLQRFLRAAQVQ